MITDFCREAVARWFIGADVTPPDIIALGMGTALPSTDDAALDEEYYRQPIDFKWSPKRFTSRFAVVLPATSPPPLPGSPSITFTEIGLLDGCMLASMNSDFETWVSGSPAYWTLDGDGTVTQGTESYEGSYAARLISGGTASLYQDLVLAACIGKTVTARLPVKTSQGSQARVGVYDGSSTSFSSFHSGGGEYEFLQVSKSITSEATHARLILQSDLAGTVDFDWIQSFQAGRLWARSVFSKKKTDGTPLELSWELASNEMEIGSLAGYLCPDRYHVFPLGKNDSVALTANYLYAIPFYLGSYKAVTEMAIHNTNTASGGRLGIYKDNGSVYPGELLVDAGVVSFSITGIKSKTGLSVNLAAETLYWLVVVCDAGVTVAATQTGTGWMPLGYDTSLYTNGDCFYRVAQAYGALPAEFPSSASALNGDMPKIAVMLEG